MDVKYIKKRIIENSEFSQCVTSDAIYFTINCIGVESSVNMQFTSFVGCDFVNFSIDESIKNILVNSLIENSSFLRKFEMFENRNRNLDILV